MGHMFSPEQIKSVVEKALPGAKAEVVDMTGTRDHYQLVVVSSAFEGKSSVERHRMVYATLGSAVGGEIHALALKTMTPAESERKNP
jgi:acid stress-induced BolA-like protein IbaG/YrbA